jgi:hypothetical protein
VVLAASTEGSRAPPGATAGEAKRLAREALWPAATSQ